MFERRPSREEQAIQDSRQFIVEYLEGSLGAIYESLQRIENKLNVEETKDDVAQPKPDTDSPEKS